MMDIHTDIYYNLFTDLSLKDIKQLFNTNKKFRKFCLDDQTFIAKTKIKALRKHLQEKDDDIREFALKNKICFDQNSSQRALTSWGLCENQNKFTVDLLYLVNNGMFDEAYTLVTCSPVVPEPTGGYIFTSKLFNTFPETLIEKYMSRLPPILELFGYESVQDFYDDYEELDSFKNKALKSYIKKNVS